ncbi:hypothetical protein MBLNU230_g6448t2 [Neophaeotheca triangularis]
MATHLIWVLGLAATALAQFVPAPTDLIETQGHAGIGVRYKQVPEGICELDPNVKSYSGYSDIDEDQHIFWWFFEARNGDPQNAPLTVWINGGPGSSSMIGLFEAQGPCGMDYDGNLTNNPYSWTNSSNMLFVDQPAQVGFSYSTAVSAYVPPTGSNIITLPNATCPDFAADWDCGTYSYPNQTNTANSTHAAAPGMWKTLQGFMGAFPEYSSNGFHFASQSYGGHYGPIFNEYIIQQNELIDCGELDAHHIDLRSVQIGNGWYDPVVQFGSYYDYTVSPGNPYNYSPYNVSTTAMLHNNMYGPGNCLDQAIDCNMRGDNTVCAAADAFCIAQVQNIWNPITERSQYDMRQLTPDPFPYSFFTDYLNSPKVQHAVGAFTNYSRSSSTVSAAFRNTGDDAREAGTYAAVASLLEAGVYVYEYAGDADYICNWLGNAAVAANTRAPGYHASGYANISTPDNIVHGQVKQSGNFAFARIFEAGHAVPF